MIEKFDEALLHLIQEYIQCGFLDVLMNIFSLIAEIAAVWFLLGSVISIGKKKWFLLSILAAALVMNYAFCSLFLKNFFRRIRPFRAHPSLISHAWIIPQGYSFPSGHSSSSFCGAFICSKFAPKYKAAVYVLAGCVAFSRLYLNVHYPSDVLAGALFGSASAAFTAWICEKIRQNRIEKEEIL